MRYLDSVSVTGFRGIQDLTLPDLGDLSVLIGASNTGKSSLLEAIVLPLETQGGGGFETVVKARSDRGLGLVTGLFPKNNDSNRIEISLGLHKSENDPEESIKTLTFNAKKADFIISDYQTFLTQFGVTDLDNYAILETSLNLTGAGTQTKQIAINLEDGSMPPGWSTGRNRLSKPLVETVSIFLPKDLMSPEQFDNAYTFVFRSGKASEWIERLTVLQPGLNDISPVKTDKGWKIFVRLSDFILPIMSMGDGFKAAAMITANTLEPGLLLIDTPELFQHPKGLRLISKSIGSAVSKYGCQVVLATQSLEFLDNIMGEAQEEKIDTKIFRFGFENDHAKAFPSYSLQEAIDSRELIGSDLRN